MNGAAYPWIRSAAPDVAGHRFVNVLVRGFWIFAQQYSGAHDLPRLAVAALRHFDFDPGFLQRMGCVGRNALDRGDFLALGAGDRSDTRAHGFAINMNGAAAA